jgi:hypothetical protein
MAEYADPLLFAERDTALAEAAERGGARRKVVGGGDDAQLAGGGTGAEDKDKEGKGYDQTGLSVPHTFSNVAG